MAGGLETWPLTTVATGQARNTGQLVATHVTSHTQLLQNQVAILPDQTLDKVDILHEI